MTRDAKLLGRLATTFAFALVGCAVCAQAQDTQNTAPHLVKKDGRYALFVEGKPYLILGAQVNNSSAWPAMLPKVWPAIHDIGANTLEIPVYWEQFEPQQGRFDYTAVDTLLQQARDQGVHLILLWFGTWKNGSQHYTPEWIKLDEKRYPHVIGANGVPVDSPSPHSKATLDADVHAFTELMRHLKQSDPDHTVLMVQVENETGTWGSVRDYSPEAQKVFEGPVPPELLRALGKTDAGKPSGNWQDVFGADAEEFFHAWSVAHFVSKVAAAGKAVYPIPLYVNAALRDPIKPGRPPSYESGGPTDNVLGIWKAAAPSIDLIGPDIYLNDSERYLKVLALYGRTDNPLFVPETGSNPAIARYFFSVLGHGGIGFSPFGIDYTGFTNEPLGATRLNRDALAPFALNYQLIGPMDREIARLNFEGKLQAVAEETDKHSQTLVFGPWSATVSYGLPQFGSGANPAGNPQPIGRAFVAQLSENQFLVGGFFCRIDFRVADAASRKQRQFLRVEEGTYQEGAFTPVRIWNGDQTDWGLNFTSVPQVLRVALSTY